MKPFLKVIGLEFLVLAFFIVNGAYVSITSTNDPFLSYLGLVPFALLLYGYLLFSKKSRTALNLFSTRSVKETLLYSMPLLIILIILYLGNGGLSLGDYSNVILVMITHILIIAFIEEVIYRGFMISVLRGNGIILAVTVSSLLFAITHSLQLLGGQDLLSTIIQISYAFSTGMVLALLIALGQPLIVTILFHGINNTFIVLASKDGDDIFTFVILAILVTYSIFLYKKLKSSQQHNHIYSLEN
ncbi:CPBP family intramembrane metalloprotease [Solibacillus sp. MA9]|uniref:CPBP family intramembrane metalloprotease n=1 Tax=Solibacillus palustris TaxID=2908203 RepID=A0ABS9UGF9_9BACL|nr:CPBP family intramembrane glutamic endopeptidase [Solibacillus sp. MA9]MCH7323450.1 CPBP family intramembrane metalloprotease [Solibacillus sp. MA9]